MKLRVTNFNNLWRVMVTRGFGQYQERFIRLQEAVAGYGSRAAEKMRLQGAKPN